MSKFFRREQKSMYSRRTLLKHFGQTTGAVAVGLSLAIGKTRRVSAAHPNGIMCPEYGGTAQINWGKNNPNCPNSSLYYLEQWSYIGGMTVGGRCCDHYINWHGCSSDATNYVTPYCTGGALN